MEKKETFEKTVLRIALPVTLQALLQSSFSIVDQVMIGQLGSSSIAGIGLAGKFASIYTVVLNAIASAAGIMISQYMGRKDEKSVSRSFYVNMAMSIGLAAVFMALCMVFPKVIMSIYSKDEATILLAVKYIRIFSISFLTMAVSSIVTTMILCMEAAALTLYASFFALVMNTGLNYLLIFGKWIFPEMGVEGAAEDEVPSGTEYMKQYLGILLPILICEFLWSLGENVYTAIYGNIGTDSCAAMTMTMPVMTIVIGALSGLSQASGILIGKSLGAKKYEQAYAESKKLMKYGLTASIILSVALIAASPLYVMIYNVEPAVKDITRSLLIAIAIISPVKVLNMILGGGIIRSGGKTKYVMCIDIIGTWVFGVPLGLFAAFVLKLPIAYVYLMLSMEECIRLGISLIVFKKRTWMESIQ